MRAKCGGEGAAAAAPEKLDFQKSNLPEGKNSFFNSDSMMFRASQSLWTIKLCTVTFLVVL